MRTAMRRWETSPTAYAALWAAGLVLVTSVGFFNRGHLALDEFFEGVLLVFPAQEQRSLIELSWKLSYHPPLGRAIRAILPRIFGAVGIEDPMWQLRFAYGAMGLFGFLGCAYFLPRCFGRLGDTLRNRKQLIVLFLCGFYCFSPLLMSRPMEESTAMPFVAATLFFACRYWRNARTRDLLYALGVVFLASHVRFQMGLLWFVIAGLAIARATTRRDLLPFLALSVALFFFGGYVEVLAQDRFYGVLRDNLAYNREVGDKHGREPFYVFLLVALGATLPPTLIAKYRGFRWKEEYNELVPAIAFFFLFLLSHTLVPHKEERFFIPALPALFLLLAPLIAFLIESGARWRIATFLAMNTVALVLININVPQLPLLKLADWMRSEGVPKNAVGWIDSLGMFPRNLVLPHPVQEDVKENPLENFLARPTSCDTAYVVRRDYVPDDVRFQERFVAIAEFDPNPLEQLIIRMNPKRNQRRRGVRVFRERSCEQLAVTKSKRSAG